MHTRPGWIALGLGLLGASSALAQSSSPYELGASQTFGHASNVRSLPDGQPIESDNFSTTTLRAALDQPIGRQRLFGDIAARHTRYSDASDLDNTGYGLRLGVDWATIERLSGTLAIGSTRQLARLNPGAAPVASTRNLETTHSADALFRLGGTGRLGLEASFGHRRVEFSAPEFVSREYDQNSVGGTVAYRPGGSLTLRTGASGQKSKYPSGFEVLPGQFEPDRSTRRDIFVGATWVPSGASTLSARIGHAEIEYDRSTNLDFSGVTGLLGWLWRPTGRLSFNTTVARDTGQEGGFAAAAATAAMTAPGGTGTGGTGTAETPTPPPSSTPSTSSAASASDFSRVTDSVGLRASYEFSSKIRFDGGISHSRRDLSSPTGGSGTDKTTMYSLGATWSPTRLLGFGCNASREVRTSSTALSSDTHANIFSCFGSLTLR